MIPTDLYEETCREMKGYRSSNKSKLFLHVARCSLVKNQHLLVDTFNQLIEGHKLADKQIKANIMKVIKNSKGPTLDQLDKQLEEVQIQLIQAANQHQNCDALTQQIMDLRKQKEKVQSRETDKQTKLHSIDEINKLVEFHKYGLVDFDEQLVRRLVEKITIFQRYMEFTLKDGEVIRVNMWLSKMFGTQLFGLGAVF